MKKVELVNTLKAMENNQEVYLSGGQWAFAVVKKNNEITVTPDFEDKVTLDTESFTYQQIVEKIEEFIYDYEEEGLDFYDLETDINKIG